VKRISTVYLDTPIFHSQRLEEGQSGQDWLTTSSDHYSYLWNVTPEPLHPQALSIDLTRAIPTHFPTTPSFLGSRLAHQASLDKHHPSSTTGYPIGTCLDQRTQVQNTFVRDSWLVRQRSWRSRGNERLPGSVLCIKVSKLEAFKEIGVNTVWHGSSCKRNRVGFAFALRLQIDALHAHISMLCVCSAPWSTPLDSTCQLTNPALSFH
jgi:hypothetical protein